MALWKQGCDYYRVFPVQKIETNKYSQMMCYKKSAREVIHGLNSVSVIQKAKICQSTWAVVPLTHQPLPAENLDSHVPFKSHAPQQQGSEMLTVH